MAGVIVSKSILVLINECSQFLSWRHLNDGTHADLACTCWSGLPTQICRFHVIDILTMDMSFGIPNQSLRFFTSHVFPLSISQQPRKASGHSFKNTAGRAASMIHGVPGGPAQWNSLILHCTDNLGISWDLSELIPRSARLGQDGLRRPGRGI